jgi:hypothetical protein
MASLGSVSLALARSRGPHEIGRGPICEKPVGPGRLSSTNRRDTNRRHPYSRQAGPSRGHQPSIRKDPPTSGAVRLEASLSNRRSVRLGQRP